METKTYKSPNVLFERHTQARRLGEGRTWRAALHLHLFRPQPGCRRPPAGPKTAGAQTTRTNETHKQQIVLRRKQF